jgi:hypothetical protein
MDRSGALRLGFAAAALALCAAAGPASPLLLREQAWTAPGPTLARDLTHAQGECLARTGADIEIGRALFRSPHLLGGPAARAGLSCHACHSNGGMNTRFLLPELTDRAGHADVTSEWASAARGDGVLNPEPIPDLAGASSRGAFGRGREPSLDVFVRGVIEDEFQGAPPTQQGFDALIAYLRALRLSACPPGDTPITLTSAANDVRRAVAAAEIADRDTASPLLLAAQDAMGRIVERLPAPHFARERRRLETLARDLGALRQGDVHAALAAAAPGWRARFDAEITRIAPREAQTYFNEATLAAALAQGG